MSPSGHPPDLTSRNSSSNRRRSRSAGGTGAGQRGSDTANQENRSSSSASKRQQRSKSGAGLKEKTQQMGTSFSSCNCSPLNKKYKYANQTGQDSGPQRWDERHTVNLRLWAEVFHVSAASGAVRWQQVSEDLVPVNVTYDQSQQGPPRVFRITAYNSQVCASTSA